MELGQHLMQLLDVGSQMVSTVKKVTEALTLERCVSQNCVGSTGAVNWPERMRLEQSIRMVFKNTMGHTDKNKSLLSSDAPKRLQPDARY